MGTQGTRRERTGKNPLIEQRAPPINFETLLRKTCFALVITTHHIHANDTHHYNGKGETVILFTRIARVGRKAKVKNLKPQIVALGPKGIKDNRFYRIVEKVLE